MEKYQIGIIGYGDFTKLMLEYLAPHADILVSSRSHKTGDAGFGAQFAPLPDILAQPIIIPSIPSQFFEGFLLKNKALINNRAVIVDVCSVKVKPLEVLNRILPKTCQIIGTHPMFGPASVKVNHGIKGLKCVICPVRAEEATYIKLRSFLSDILGLKVLDRTPEAHDKEMAYVQGLSHYIGRLMSLLNIPESELGTLAYQSLLEMKRIQGGDSWDLFESIMQQNPYAAALNQKFKDACHELDSKLTNN